MGQWVNSRLHHCCRPSGCRRSPLLPFLLNQTFPRNFLEELVLTSYEDGPAFSRIFSPLLQGLVQAMHSTALDSDDFRQPLLVLSELCEVKVNQSRLLCNLVSEVVIYITVPKIISNTDSCMFFKTSHDITVNSVWPSNAIWHHRYWSVFVACCLIEASHDLNHILRNTYQFILNQNTCCIWCIFLNEKGQILIKISLKFVPKGPGNNNLALV